MHKVNSITVHPGNHPGQNSLPRLKNSVQSTMLSIPLHTLHGPRNKKVEPKHTFMPIEIPCRNLSTTSSAPCCTFFPMNCANLAAPSLAMLSDVMSLQNRTTPSSSRASIAFWHLRGASRVNQGICSQELAATYSTTLVPCMYRFLAPNGCRIIQ